MPSQFIFIFQRTLLSVFLLLTLSTFAHAQARPAPKPKSNWDSFVETVGGFFSGITGAGEVNPRRCTNCTPTTASTPLPIDKTIGWLRNHLKCDNFSYLQAQRNNLIRAEREFGIPAPMIACLIATESAWDINADQLNTRTGDFRGSFVGLVQAYAPAFDLIRNEIATDPTAKANWERYNPGMSPNILRRETMLARQGIVLGCPITRCGGVASPRDKERIARASIAFVSIYIRDNINKMKDFLRSSPQYGPAVAERYGRTQHTQYLAGAIGYNAGANTVVDYLPPAAYTTDSGDWRYSIRNRLPNVKRALTAKDRENAVAKTGEVIQYVDWIHSCMVADPKIGPADRSAHLYDKDCFGGEATPANIRKMLAVRKPSKPNCVTDPSPACAGPNARSQMIDSLDFLTPKQISEQSAKCPAPPKPPKGQVVCPK